MRPAAVVLVLAAALAIAIPLSPIAGAQDPEECTYNPDTGEYECNFDGGDGGDSSGGDDGPWWATSKIEVGLAVFGLTASAVGGGYATWRARKRRARLRELLDEIERVYSEHKTAPSEGLPVLAELRSTVREDHDAGRLTDEQFMELDNRLGEAIARLRLLKLDRDLPELSESLDREVRHVVEDGIVSWTDVDHVETRCEETDVPDDVAEPLMDLLGEWAERDEPARQD